MESGKPISGFSLNLVRCPGEKKEKEGKINSRGTSMISHRSNSDTESFANFFRFPQPPIYRFNPKKGKVDQRVDRLESR